jgi:hypothetical protein
MTKGGYHPDSRALGVLAEIQVEACCGRRSTSRRERDMSFEEIVRLVKSVVGYLERQPA